MTTSGADLLSLEELSSALAAYAGPSQARTRTRHARNRWMSRRLALALALVALLIAGCSYAVHFNPYRWISAADHPRTSSDTPPAALSAAIANWNKSFKSPSKHMLAETARFVHQLPNGMRFYAVATTTGQICLAAMNLPGETLPNGVTFEKGGATYTCGYSLSPSRPITVDSEQNGSVSRGKQIFATPINYGLAADGVTAITFGGKLPNVTVRVTDNVWAYLGRIDQRRVVIHWDDGRTQRVCWTPIAETWTTHLRACPLR